MPDDVKATERFLSSYLRFGITSLNELINNGLTVKHMRF